MKINIVCSALAYPESLMKLNYCPLSLSVCVCVFVFMQLLRGVAHKNNNYTTENDDA